VGEPVPTSLQIQNEITLEAWIYATQYPSNDLGLIVGSQYDTNMAGVSIFLDGRINPDGQTSQQVTFISKSVTVHGIPPIQCHGAA